MEPKKKWMPTDDDRYINVSFNVVPMPDAIGDETSKLFLLPWGETTLVDAAFREMFGEPGVMIVDDAAADMVKINFGAAPIDLHINLDHQWRYDGSTAAVGWITGVYANETDGLGVEVEWTDEGRSLIESKAYRYASGEFSADRLTGRVVAVAGGALTNSPAAESGMRPVTLSLITADDEPLQPAHIGQKEVPNMELLAFLARKIGRNIDDDSDGVVAVSELSDQARLSETLTTELATSRAEVETLTAKLSKLEGIAKVAEDAATKTRVDAALLSGQISPAQVEWATGQAEEAFTVYLGTVTAGTYTPPPQIVDEDEINKPKTNSAEVGNQQARADEIGAYAKKNEMTFSEANAILGRKGA